jgi:peptidoglycan hydrolase-like protein with peptidoglycan-binding domain
MGDEPAFNEMSLLELQSRLRDLGYYDGPLEDHPWRATFMALTKFQRDRGLQVTSRPDSATARALRESICF